MNSLDPPPPWPLQPQPPQPQQQQTLPLSLPLPLPPLTHIGFPNNSAAILNSVMGFPNRSHGDAWIRHLPSVAFHPINKDQPHPSSPFGGGLLLLDSGRGELVTAQSKLTPKEVLEAKALAASKSHSEAERRRRERINSHLATLRTLLPSSTKTDKASLLADVIGQLKLLKQQVSEVYEVGVMPTDVDELKVEEEEAPSAEGKLLIKASVCCEDRTDLTSDLIHAFDSLGLRVLKAEISTLGGRSRNIVSLTTVDKVADALEGEEKGGPSVNNVQEALRQVMERARGGSSDMSPGSSNKRPRLGSFELN